MIIKILFNIGLTNLSRKDVEKYNNKKSEYKYQCEWCDSIFSDEPFIYDEHIFCSGTCETEYVNWQDEPFSIDDNYIKRSDYDWMA